MIHTYNYFSISMCEWYFVIKKESLAQGFSREFCKISKNTFFTEHLRTIASGSLLNSSNCLCVKGIRLCNCLCSSSSPSSREFASVIRNIEKYAKIWATFHSYPSDTRQEQCLDVYNPLQTVFKRFKLYILAQIIWEINYYIAGKCFSQYL